MIALFINSKSVIYPYNGILIHKKEKMLIHATVWINLKNIMLNYRS